MLLAGIDEAGYGPMLGPLCVGMSVFRIEGADPEANPDVTPDLWKLLISGVARKPDRRGRVAVADSKALKLSNDSKTRHPLVHLERGVLAFLGASRADSEALAADDAGLFAALGMTLPRRAWYQTEATALPLGATAGEMSIAANLVRRACSEGNCRLVGLGARAIGEEAFNEIVESRGSKAEATLEAIGRHLIRLIEIQREHGDVVHLVCDRLGGRQAYGAALSKLMKDAGAPAWVDVLHEAPDNSSYTVRHDGGTIRVDFRVEGESAWLPTALASMTAKLCRELAMVRFNRYWSDRLADLKPTAGYYTDAQRWLKDAGGVVTEEERGAMVRRA